MSSGDQPVPLIIGGSSSMVAQILSRILGPLSLPLVGSTGKTKEYFEVVAFSIYFL